MRRVADPVEELVGRFQAAAEQLKDPGTAAAAMRASTETVWLSNSRRSRRARSVATTRSRVGEALIVDPRPWPLAATRNACSTHRNTSGTSAGSPTPAAQVADNDLALGRMVEGISKSRFWPDSLILVVEDDAQDGADRRHPPSSRRLSAAPARLLRTASKKTRTEKRGSSREASRKRRPLAMNAAPPSLLSPFISAAMVRLPGPGGQCGIDHMATRSE